MIKSLNVPVLAILFAARALAGDSAPDVSGTQAGPGVCQDAVLRNGSRIQNVRREAAGNATRLWLCANASSDYVEIPTEQIAGFEQTTLSPIAPAPAAPASAPKTSSNSVARIDVPIKNLIAEAASRYRIDPDFVTSVVKAESGFNPAAVSPKGARGLMQLMPQTAAGLGVDNVLDPASNLDGGTRYLRQLLDQYDGDVVKALTAYNAGPGRVDKYGGIPPFAETRGYIARVVEDYSRKKSEHQAHSTATSGDK
jgi:soluble lytic murein transglycosylase-like protein